MRTPPTRGLLDTSVFIATENARPLDESGLPEEVAVSVVTVAELHAGVLVTSGLDTRARRLDTLSALADVHVLRIDEHVAMQWARLRVHLAEAGRRVNVNDLWIAATAVAHGLPVITQDADFDPLGDVTGLDIVRV
ncbi:MAG TPA: type II toxin-antitoxin system VapC family toxin [Cryptosporangiaceae bacterium]|nr:type II toxin-antitoxin system VapC family toxin [Cryptosporangiaceae bacterium]